ncbi:helix-turn-helix domain-containing protein [Lederbergia lenta]|uniref:helix-turn-helix domain-containing protein n=1 Tax=Lederbergia lenta TaxID=1467 RepID=UPI00203E1DF0|nr:helix-turn-helix domain-containing protein [Lederbergia lenta]MCM3110640.1 helix-turn-helix domain-containing protein [Lederbergia lenta]
MSLGSRLKDERESRNWSQVTVAKKIGITNAVLSNYERDYRDPDTETLKKLAELYEVSIDYLLGHETKGNDLTYYKNKIATEFPDIDLMFKDLESFTVEEMKEVYDYIKYKKSQRKGE